MSLAVTVLTLWSAHASAAGATPAFGPAQVVAPRLWPIDAAVHTDGSAIVVVTDGDTVGILSRSAGGRWTGPELMPDGEAEPGSVSAAFDAAGNATVTWGDMYYGTMYVVTRPAGAPAFGPPELIATNVMWGDFELAPSGAAVFAWRRWSDWSMSAKFRPAGGTFGAEHDFKAGGEFPDAAIGADGTAAVVWHAQSYPPKLAVRPAGSGAWEDPVDLGPAMDGMAAPGVAVDADGNTLAIWGSTITRLRPAGASSPLEDPQTIAGFGSAGLALDADGNATVLLLRQEPTPGGHFAERLYAAYRPAGGEFGEPVPVSRADQTVDYVTRLAVAPDGSAMAIWRSYDQDLPQRDWSMGPPPDGAIHGSVRSGGTWGPVQVLAPQGSQRTAVAYGGVGLAAWAHTFGAFPEPGCGQLEVSEVAEGPATDLTPPARGCDPDPEPSPTGGGGPPGGDATPQPPPDDEPPPADTRAPRVVVGGRSKQRAHVARRIEFELRCDESCKGTARVTLTLKPRKATSKSSEVALRKTKFAARPGSPAHVRLHLSDALAKRLQRLLAAGGKATAAVSVSANDPSSNRTTAGRKIALVR